MADFKMVKSLVAKTNSSFPHWRSGRFVIAPPENGKNNLDLFRDAANNQDN